MALPTRVQRGQTDPMEQVNREFEGFFNRMLGRDMDGGQFAPYGVDVREDADHIYVEAELPGFTKDDVDITLENQTLTITAERNQDSKQQQKGGYLLRERRYNRFQRSFNLPPTVDEQTVNAKLDG